MNTTDTTSVVFGQTALTLGDQGWRPIPLITETKLPAEPGWNRYNQESCPPDELRQMASHHYDCATGIALPTCNLALDIDITDVDKADEVRHLAAVHLGETPLERIGQAPKSVHIYRADRSINASKPHPIELYSGSGQVAVFGWHKKAGRPYQWPVATPLEIRADSSDLPMVNQRMVRNFLSAAEPILDELRRERLCNGGAGIGLDASQQLSKLLSRGLSFRHSAQRVLQGAVDGGRHYAVRAVVSAGYNYGMDADEIENIIVRYAPVDLLNLVSDDGYLDRVLNDFMPVYRDNSWRGTAC